MKDITVEYLISLGFVERKLPGGDGWDDFNEYSKTLKNKDGETFYVDFRHNLSNTPNRDWSIHIDNELCETIAYVDVQSVYHVNGLFEIMNIEYRL